MITQAYDLGKKLSEDTAWRLYCNYTKGKYCLSWEAVRNTLSIPDDIQDVRMVEHDLKYKEERVQIREYLREKGVKWFYHFTERDKLSSIKREGGLLSYRQYQSSWLPMGQRDDKYRQNHSRWKITARLFNWKTSVPLTVQRLFSTIYPYNFANITFWALRDLTAEVKQLCSN